MSAAATYRLPCDACEGEGGKRTIIPWAGEAIAADIWEDVCEACEGEGESDELLCSGCDKPVADGGECESCADPDDVALAPRRAA